jgi:hypothetical protein
MGLRLQTVAASHGLRWVREGFGEFLHRPLGYILLFVLFMVAALFVSVLPIVGAMLLMMGVPLLSLAFMMAMHDAAHGRPPHPRVYLQAWQGVPAARRRAMLTLCFAYAALTALIMAASDLIDGGRFDALLMAAAGPDANADELQKLADAPGVFQGVVARSVLTLLLSIPFWHAPALVLWGHQGPAQALFSSALAIWRSRGAFSVYLLSWCAAIIGMSLVLSVLAAWTGGVALAGLLTMPMALMLSVAFYTSLYPGFRDLFGEPESLEPIPPPSR